MAKTIQHYLNDLRTDLKDSGAVWSDAELTRCVEKAVADYSRFNPRERQREITIDYEVDDESVTLPTTSDIDYFVAAYDLNAKTDGAVATMAAYVPDVPRPVRIAVTDANTSITQLVIIVKGYDEDNKYIEEFFYLEGGLIQTGQHYFSRVTEVELDEIAGNGAADLLNVGTGTDSDVWRRLAYRPIKSASLTRTGSTLDTDFEVDYAEGRIRRISDGNLVAGTAYTVDYTRSRIDIDLSTLIDDLIKVERVEYPSGSVPQNHSKFEVWGDILTVAGDMVSQAEMTDAEHLIIKYLVSHSAPSAQSSGSYPSYLDTTVQLAATAYALLIEALQYTHAAATNITNAGTALTAIAAIHTACDAALDKVITYLESNTNEDAKYWLTKITTDIANLRTSIETALDAAASGLGEVDTTSLDKATTGAEGLLDAGDNFIDTVNDGDNVPGLYRDYSLARAQIANARLAAASQYIAEATARMANLNSYIAQAGGWMAVASGFVEEASGRLGEMDRYLQEAALHQQTADINLRLAEVYRTEAFARRDEAWAIWMSPSQISPTYSLGQRRQLV